MITYSFLIKYCFNLLIQSFMVWAVKHCIQWSSMVFPFVVQVYSVLDSPSQSVLLIVAFIIAWIFPRCLSTSCCDLHHYCMSCKFFCEFCSIQSIQQRLVIWFCTKLIVHVLINTLHDISILSIICPFAAIKISLCCNFQGCTFVLLLLN